jgi:hypothetical protein
MDDYDEEATQSLDKVLYADPGQTEALALSNAYSFLLGVGFYRQLRILIGLCREFRPPTVDHQPNPAITPETVAKLIKLRDTFLMTRDRRAFMEGWVAVTREINTQLSAKSFQPLALPDSKDWRKSNIDHMLSTSDPQKFNKKLRCLMTAVNTVGLATTLSEINDASLRKKERYVVLKNFLLARKHTEANNPNRALAILRPMAKAGNQLAMEVIVFLYIHSNTTLLPAEVMSVIKRLSVPSAGAQPGEPRHCYFKRMAKRIEILQGIAFDDYLTCLEMKQIELKSRRCPKAAEVFGELAKTLRQYKREFLRNPPAASPADEMVLERSFLIKCREQVEIARNNPIVTEHRGLGDLIARLLNNVLYVLSCGRYNPRASMIKDNPYAHGFFRPKTHSLLVLESNPFPKTVKVGNEANEAFWGNVEQQTPATLGAMLDASRT